MAESTEKAELKRETDHIVAILDLLGASEKIMSDQSEIVLNVISYLFEKAGSDWVRVGNAPQILRKIKTVTFSDNIAFALELPEPSESGNETEDAIQSFIKYMSVFQSAALKSKMLFRGGISLGSLYMDSSKNIVWGKALVEAYNLEEKAAIYPRVVLSRKFDKFALSKMERVRKDLDGIYFIDYIPLTNKTHPDWIEKAKKLIQDEYDNAAQKEAEGKWGQERIVQKYAWLQHYIEQCE